MSHPYENLPGHRSWRQAVGARNFLEISDLWQPKISISKRDKIITAGSCFAQHISRAMQMSGYNWVDYEPGPKYLLPEQLPALNYGVYSFRTSNIYTVRALRQWIEWAFNDGKTIVERVWESEGRFIDPYRPAIELGGFETAEQVEASRHTTLRAIKAAVSDASVFIFTLGLTESWRSRASGETYAVCPGTTGGTFDAAAHVFINSDYTEILEDAEWIIAQLKAVNPNLRFLLTVSPVPLTATASALHILPATIYSKSVLRAVAGKLTQTHAHVDYFPSYEIVSAFPYKAAFFEQNMRSVAKAGVAHVMKNFLAALGGPPLSDDKATTYSAPPPQADMTATDTLVCEEQFLDRA